MKQNIAEMDTMMFYEEVLEDHQTMMLPAMAEALVECRYAVRQAARLNETGEVGLIRLTEIWCALQDAPGVVVLEGNDTKILTDVLAQIHAAVAKYPLAGPVGLSLCVELHYMMDCIKMGEWFE